VLTGLTRREQRKLAAAPDSQRPVPPDAGTVRPVPPDAGTVRPVPAVQLVRLLTSSSELQIR
jgi:hypothetical protein